MTDALASPSLASDAPGEPGALVAALAEVSEPPRTRARARLVLLCAALAIWTFPWRSDGAKGGALTGASALVSFLAVWALAAAALLARTRKGLLVGEAVASAVAALAMAALVHEPHPWLPGADRSATCLPIFAPLCALALLDAASRLRRVPLGGEVAAIRGATAFLCAGALFVADDLLPAVVALLLAAAPLLVARPATARGARRGLEALALLYALGLFLAREVHPRLSPRGAGFAAEVETATHWPFVFFLVTAAVVVLSGRGVLIPEGLAEGASEPARAGDAPAPS